MKRKAQTTAHRTVFEENLRGSVYRHDDIRTFALLYTDKWRVIFEENLTVCVCSDHCLPYFSPKQVQKRDDSHRPVPYIHQTLKSLWRCRHIFYYWSSKLVLIFRTAKPLTFLFLFLLKGGSKNYYHDILLKFRI